MNRLFLPALIALLSGLPAGAQDTTALPSGLSVWDTGCSPSKGIGKKAGWTRVSRGKKPSSFKGDAVVANGRLVVRFERTAVTVHSLERNGAVPRVRLNLTDKNGTLARRLRSVRIVEHTRGAAAIEAVYETEQQSAATATFRIKRGDVFVEAKPGSGADRLRISCPGRFAVLPDFFADDMVVDARRIAATSAEVPSENFLLHLAKGGDAIAMCVFENRDQDVRVFLSGEGTDRVIEGSEIRFGNGKRIWLALLRAPRIWHPIEIRAQDARKVRPMNWKMPFPAQWRVDFTCADGLTSSWEMLLQDRKGGDYWRASWLGKGIEKVRSSRKYWTGSLHYSVEYPCWSDSERNGYVQPLKKAWVAFRGPAVVYPINRVASTPLDAYTVVDVVRNTLGVGPCEYILDVESQGAERKGRATCSVRDELKWIFEKGEQKSRRRDIERFLAQGLEFVRHIRGRIDGYLEFALDLRVYLSEQKKLHPGIAGSLNELNKLLDRMEEQAEDRRVKIKSVDYVVRATEDFRKNVMGTEGPDALARCKRYTDALTEVGGNQDDLVARCRWFVKAIRQRVGMIMAEHPALAPVAAEIRRRTQKVLRNSAIHEGGRR